MFTNLDILGFNPIIEKGTVVSFMEIRAKVLEVFVYDKNCNFEVDIVGGNTRETWTWKLYDYECKIITNKEK